MIRRALAPLALTALLLAACGDDDDHGGAPATPTAARTATAPPDATRTATATPTAARTATPTTAPATLTPTAAPLALRWDFAAGEQGWTAGFADYPLASADLFELVAGPRPLPAELGLEADGFYLHGANRSDDLFMFLARRLGPADGIVAGAHYRVRFTIRVASDAPSGCVGIGGAPGESVTLKAGAVGREPIAALDANGDLRMTVDKGEQATGGPAASVVGSIANGVPCASAGDPRAYVLLTREHTHDSDVTATPGGELWLLIGTDSGFEGATGLYYLSVEATLTRSPD